jgi:hypothetical protein
MDMLIVPLEHMRSDVASGGGRGAYPREAYMSRLDEWRGFPVVHRVGGLGGRGECR